MAPINTHNIVFLRVETVNEKGRITEAQMRCFGLSAVFLQSMKRKFSTEILLRNATEWSKAYASIPRGAETEAMIAAGLAHKNAGIKNKYRYIRGCLLFTSASYSEAQAFFSSALEHSASQSVEAAQNLYWVARTNYLLGKFDVAIVQCQEAIGIFSEKLDQAWLAQCYFLLSGIFINLGFLDDALYMTNYAGEYYQSTGRWNLYLLSLINSGNVFKRLKKFDVAVSEFEKGEVVIAENSIADKNLLGNFYKHLADVYLQKNDLKKGEETLLKIGTPTEVPSLHPFLQCLYYNTQANICYLKKDFAGVITQCDKAHQVAKTINAGKPIITSIRLTGDAYMQMNELNKAGKKLKEALELSEENKWYQMQYELYDLLSELETRKKNYRQALTYTKRATEIRDEVNLHETDIRLNAVQAMNELKRKREELLKAEKQLALQSQELELATLYLNQKTALLNDLESFLQLMRKENAQKQKVFKQLHEKIKSAKVNGSENDAFKMRFDEANKKFVLALRTAIPQVTKGEAQVAALLKHGMNTKEISELLVIDARSVEMHRYRLRKKLNLKRADDLLIVLNKIAADSPR